MTSKATQELRAEAAGVRKWRRRDTAARERGIVCG